MQVLFDAGYEIYDAGGDYTVIYIYPFDTNCCWEDEDPGVFQLENIYKDEYYTVQAMVCPDGRIEFHYNNNADLYSLIPPIRIKDESKLLGIIDKLENVFSDDTPLEEGNKIIQDILSEFQIDTPQPIQNAGLNQNTKDSIKMPESE